jgi:hypothetical protein
MQRITPGSGLGAGRDRLLGCRAPAAAGDAKLRDLGTRSLSLQPAVVPIERAARLPGVRHADSSTSASAPSSIASVMNVARMS